jgi:dynein heavy chain
VKKRTADLLEVVAAVRSSVTKLQRCTLSALIVVDVHNRDVVQELASGAVRDESDFEWTSQLRYYLENNLVSPHPLVANGVEILIHEESTCTD